jgi:hypothetical protein
VTAARRLAPRPCNPLVARRPPSPCRPFPGCRRARSWEAEVRGRFTDNSCRSPWCRARRLPTLEPPAGAPRQAFGGRRARGVGPVCGVQEENRRPESGQTGRSRTSQRRAECCARPRAGAAGRPGKGRPWRRARQAGALGPPAGEVAKGPLNAGLAGGRLCGRRKAGKRGRCAFASPSRGEGSRVSQAGHGPLH